MRWYFRFPSMDMNCSLDRELIAIPVCHEYQILLFTVYHTLAKHLRCLTKEIKNIQLKYNTIICTDFAFKASVFITRQVANILLKICAYQWPSIYGIPVSIQFLYDRISVAKSGLVPSLMSLSLASSWWLSCDTLHISDILVVC